MPLKVNNTNVGNILWVDSDYPDGVNVARVVYNGTTVWEAYLAYTLLSDGTYSVKAINGATVPSELVIPSTYNGAAVKGVSSQAFANRT